MPPCRPRRRKFDYEMVHSEVYVNNVVSTAPFSTPACPDCSQNIQKTALSCMFSLSNFSSIFPGGVSSPHLPLCADAHEYARYTLVGIEKTVSLNHSFRIKLHTPRQLALLCLSLVDKKNKTCNGTETNCVNDQMITSNVTNIHTRTYMHWVRLINELEYSTTKWLTFLSIVTA